MAGLGGLAGAVREQARRRPVRRSPAGTAQRAQQQAQQQVRRRAPRSGSTGATGAAAGAVVGGRGAGGAAVVGARAGGARGGHSGRAGLVAGAAFGADRRRLLEAAKRRREREAPRNIGAVARRSLRSGRVRGIGAPDPGTVERLFRFASGGGIPGLIAREIAPSARSYARGESGALAVPGQLAELVGRGQTTGGPLTPSLAEQAAGTRSSTVRPASFQLSEAPVAGNLLGDVVAFPANVVPSLYASVSAAAAAAGGDTDPAERLVGEFLEGDPIALAARAGLSALGVTDDDDPGELIAQAGNAIGEHPGLFLAEIAGGAGAASRAVGFASRGFRRRPRVRAERTAPGTQHVQRDYYSKGIVGELVQRSRDRRARGRMADLLEQADEAEVRQRQAVDAGRPVEAMVLRDESKKLREEAYRLDPTLATDVGVRRRMDLHEGKAQTRQRAGRRAVDDLVLGETGGRLFRRRQDGVLIPAEEGGHLQRLIAEGFFRDAAGAAAYLQRLEEIEPFMEGHLREANRIVQDDIRSALNSGIDIEKVAERTKASVDLLNELEGEAVGRGILDPDEALRAKLKTYAVVNMGAEDRDGIGLAVRDENAGQVREALEEAEDELTRAGEQVMRYERARASFDTPTAAAAAQRAQAELKERQQRVEELRQAVEIEEESGGYRALTTDEIIEHFETEGRAAAGNVSERTRRVEASYQRRVAEYDRLLGEREQLVEAHDQPKLPGYQKHDLRTRIGEVEDEIRRLHGETPLLPRRGESRSFPDDGERGTLVRVEAMDNGYYRLAYNTGYEPIVGRLGAEDAAAERLGDRRDAPPASPEDAARYRRALDETATEHGMRLEFSENPNEWQAAEGVATVPPVRSQADLAVGLHEIAHAVLGHERQHGLRRSYGDHEQAAWDWSLRRLGEPPNEHTLAVARAGLRSYGQERDLPDPPPRDDARLRALAETEFEAEGAPRTRSVDEIAFITQRPRSSEGSFNRRYDTAKGLPTQRRTGAAALQGIIDTDPEVIREQAQRTQAIINADQGFREMVAEFGLRGENGRLLRFDTKAEALDYARTWNLRPDALNVTVIRLNPWGGRSGQVEALVQYADSAGRIVDEDGKVQHSLSEVFTKALDGEGPDGKGVWGLMLNSAADQAKEHALVSQSVSPAWRALGQAFRRTVLPFSLPWMTGNVAEAEVRSLLAGSVPFGRDGRFYRQVIEAMRESSDPVVRKIAADLEQLRPAGHYGGVSRTDVRARREELERTPAGRLVAKLMTLREKPGARQTADAVRAYQDFVFDRVNAGIESRYTQRLAGQWLTEQLGSRRARLVAGRPGWVGKLLWPEKARRAQERAVQDAIDGLRETPAQFELAEWVRRAYGQYESFSPELRRAMATWTPFYAWTRNAIRFLSHTIPVEHPAFLASVAALDGATREWRIEHGLEAATGVEGQVPPFLRGSIPTPEWLANLLGVEAGSPLRLARYTPFGFGTDPANTVASLFLPQISGALDALQGREFTGRQIRDDQGNVIGTEDRIGRAMLELIYATVPGVSLVSRAVLDKEGSVGARVRQVVNPFEPVARPDDAERPPARSDDGEASEDDIVPGTIEPIVPSDGGGIIGGGEIEPGSVEVVP